MENEIQILNTECNRIKNEVLSKSLKNTSDDIIDILEITQHNTELTQKFLADEFKTLIVLSEKLTAEFNGDKVNLKNKLESILENYMDDVISEIMDFE